MVILLFTIVDLVEYCLQVKYEYDQYPTSVLSELRDPCPVKLRNCPKIRNFDERRTPG